MIAMQLLPFYELLSVSHRAEGIDIAALNDARSSADGYALVWTLRQLFGKFHPLYTPVYTLSMNIILLVLSIYGIVISKKPVRIFFLTGWIFIELMLYFPPFYELLHMFPPFSYDRFPVAWIFLLPICTGGLAGLGITALEEGRKLEFKDMLGSINEKPLRRENLLFLIPFLLFIYAAFISRYVWYPQLIPLTLIGLSIIAVIRFEDKRMKILSSTLIIALGLMVYARASRPIEKQARLPQAGIEELRTLPLCHEAHSFLERNSFSRIYSVTVLEYAKQMFAQINLINGSEYSLMIGRMQGIAKFYEYGWAKWENFAEKPAFLNIMGTGLIMVPQRGVHLFFEKPQQFKLLCEDEKHCVFVNRQALPRCFLVHNVRIIKDRIEIFERLRDNKIDLSQEVILEEELPETFILEEPPEMEAVPEIKEYRPEEVVIEATLKTGGFLLLHDSFYPGWKAYDNGGEIRIYLANYLFRGVYLTPGKHTVRFSYEPASFQWGIRMSILGWAVVLGFVGYKGGRVVYRRLRRMR
jgi:hypothetical protein